MTPNDCGVFEDPEIVYELMRSKSRIPLVRIKMIKQNGHYFYSYTMQFETSGSSTPCMIKEYQINYSHESCLIRAAFECIKSINRLNRNHTPLQKKAIDALRDIIKCNILSAKKIEQPKQLSLF